MDFSQILTSNRQRIINTCDKYGVKNVRVFGSFARGEADEKSDVDLLVTIGGKFGLFELVRLEKELSSILGRKVDVVSDKLQRPRFRDRVLKDARLLWETNGFV